mgnify:CR=1 FL=1
MIEWYVYYMFRVILFHIESYHKERARLAKHDTSGAIHYVRCCEEMGVVPVKFFLRCQEQSKFVMRYHGLGYRGATALCIPLEVSLKLHHCTEKISFILITHEGVEALTATVCHGCF